MLLCRHDGLALWGCLFERLGCHCQMPMAPIGHPTASAACEKCRWLQPHCVKDGRGGPIVGDYLHPLTGAVRRNISAGRPTGHRNAFTTVKRVSVAQFTGKAGATLSVGGLVRRARTKLGHPSHQIIVKVGRRGKLFAGAAPGSQRGRNGRGSPLWEELRKMRTR